jgi:hypothetical protein
MRTNKYELTFKLPSGEEIRETGLQASPLRARITELLKTHYYIDYQLSRDSVYELVSRPNNVLKHIRDKVKVQRC